MLYHQLLTTVPAIGMQFVNDTEWLGGEVEKLLEREKSLEVDTSGEGKGAVRKMMGLGMEWREKLIVSCFWV